MPSAAPGKSVVSSVGFSMLIMVVGVMLTSQFKFARQVAM
jgi:hypothetical protein